MPADIYWDVEQGCWVVTGADGRERVSLGDVVGVRGLNVASLATLRAIRATTDLSVGSLAHVQALLVKATATVLGLNTGTLISGGADVVTDNLLAKAQSADHTAGGLTITATAGENLAQFETGYLKSDGKIWKAKGDAAATSNGLLVMALAAINADASGVCILVGFVRDDTWNWTVGGRLFVSPATAGALTQTTPTSGQFERTVGFAYSADIIHFNPSQTLVAVT